MLHGTNPSRGSKWPAALVCIQNTQGVHVHQWMGGGNRRERERDGEMELREGDVRGLHPLPRGEGCVCDGNSEG